VGAVGIKLCAMAAKNDPRQNPILRREDRYYYLDYEGFIEHRPSIAGLLIDGVFRQFTFESALEPLAADLGVEYCTWPAWVDSLANLHDQGYLAVGYSMHEADKTTELGAAESWYRNAHRFLKRQVQWPEGTRPHKWDLESVARHLGMETKTYGTKQATQRLRYVLQFAAKYGTTAKFTPTAKAKWTKLLNYNKQDVKMLHFVVQHGLQLRLRQACQ